MKKIFLAATALAALVAGPAYAADMPEKAPVSKAPPSVPYSWTSCYLGGNGGGGWDRVQVTRVFAPNGAPENNNYGTGNGSGWLAGGQIGCDYQTGNFVFGAQLMADAAGIQSDHGVPITFVGGRTFSYHTKVNAIATLTGRVGVTLQPMLLAYVKGGAASKSEDLFVRGDVPLSFLSETANRVGFNGWTVGGGFEYAWSPSFSLFLEGDYAGFGTKRISFIAAPGTVGAGTVGDIMDQNQSVISVVGGLAWRFNWSGLVRAVY